MIYEINNVLRRCRIRIWISKSLRRSRGKKHSKEKISKIITCFTSQLTNLTPNFVRPHVPRQSDHVIRHMMRCNTEAYANI